MVSPLDADCSAQPVDVVDFEVVFALVRCVGVVNDETVPLLLHQGVEGPQFRDGVEEDDDLGFGLNFGESFKDPENHLIFVSGLAVIVTHSLKALVLVVGI